MFLFSIHTNNNREWVLTGQNFAHFWCILEKNVLFLKIALAPRKVFVSHGRFEMAITDFERFRKIYFR